MRVVSVDADATQTVLAVTDSAGNHVNQPPPRGVQDFLVGLSVTYTGAGSGDISSLVNSLQTLGSHNVAYDVRDNPCGLLPPLDLAGAGPVEVRSGDTVTGNVCFQIASNDARSLLLHAGDLLLKTDFWFALR